MGTWKMAIPMFMAAAAFTATAQDKGKVGTSGAPDDLSGAQMYRTYCAACHGVDGRGFGPVAPALKAKLPDLTQIARKNNGQFPTFRVTHIIDGYEVEAAHGTRDMPVWGDFFRDMKRDETMLQLREHNLTDYIRSIQQK